MGEIILRNGTLTNGSLRKFSPLDFSPVLWLDSADESTITKDGSDKVSQWDDKSGNGRNATQGTAARQPTWLPTGFNGKPTLRFDADNLLTSYTFDFNDPIHIFIVSGNSTAGAFKDYVFAQFKLSGGNARQIQMHSSTDGSSWVVGIRDNSDTAFNANLPYANGVLEFFTTATESFLVINGSVSGAMAGLPSTNNQEDIDIASLEEGSGPYHADISAVIIYNKILTAVQISALRIYLINEYGV